MMRERGFTLIELVTVLGIGASVVVLLVRLAVSLFDVDVSTTVVDRVREIEQAVLEFQVGEQRQKLTVDNPLGGVWPENMQQLIDEQYAELADADGPWGGIVSVDPLGDVNGRFVTISILLPDWLTPDDLAEIAFALGPLRTEFDRVPVVTGGVTAERVQLRYRTSIAQSQQYVARLFEADDYVQRTGDTLSGNLHLGGFDVVDVQNGGDANGVSSGTTYNYVFVPPANRNTPIRTVVINHLQVGDRFEPSLLQIATIRFVDDWVSPDGNTAYLANQRYISLSSPIILGTFSMAGRWETTFGARITYRQHMDYGTYISSDERRKTDIDPVNAGWATDVVRGAPARSYRTLHGDDWQVGLLAGEVSEVPGLTTARSGYDAIDYRLVPAVLWSALRDRMEEVKALEGLADESERKLELLKAQVKQRQKAAKTEN